MVDLPLTKEIILDTAEKVFRRFGPDKATVVDVARALDVSHGTIYRHFTSKVALREAVADRWLHRVSIPLAEILNQPGSVTERLRRWFDTLMGIKRTKALEDPELFAMYSTLAEEAVEVVNVHISDLISQLARIVEDGIMAQEFKAGDAVTIASAIFFATVRFHHPAHFKEWSSPSIDQEFDAVWSLILSGIVQPGR